MSQWWDLICQLRLCTEETHRGHRQGFQSLSLRRTNKTPGQINHKALKKLLNRLKTFVVQNWGFKLTPESNSHTLKEQQTFFFFDKRHKPKDLRMCHHILHWARSLCFCGRGKKIIPKWLYDNLRQGYTHATVSQQQESKGMQELLADVSPSSRKSSITGQQSLTRNVSIQKCLRSKNIYTDIPTWVWVSLWYLRVLILEHLRLSSFWNV